MTERTKIKVTVKQYRSVPLQYIKDSYDNEGSLRNAMGLLNPLLHHLQLPPDEVQYDVMNRRAEDIIQYIKGRYPTSGVVNQRAYLKKICGILTRTGFGQDHRLNSLVDAEFPYVEQDGATDVVSWTDRLLPLLKSASRDDECTPVIRIIASLYAYGYVFRPAQIFSTRVKDDGVSNFLDLQTGRYEIRDQKSKKKISFILPPDLLAKITPHSGDVYLLQNSRGDCFSSSRCFGFEYHGWKIRHTSRDFRKSYDTWLHNESGKSDAERREADRILGHTTTTAKSYYVERQDESSDDLS